MKTRILRSKLGRTIVVTVRRHGYIATWFFKTRSELKKWLLETWAADRNLTVIPPRFFE